MPALNNLQSRQTRSAIRRAVALLKTPLYGPPKKVAPPKIERQEIHCHECDQYVQFPVDLSMDGNHVLRCPNCGHEHCRVVRNGRITEDRWDSRNGQTYYVSSYSITTSSTSATSDTALFVGGDTSSSYTWTISDV